MPIYIQTGHVSRFCGTERVCEVRKTPDLEGQRGEGKKCGHAVVDQQTSRPATVSRVTSRPRRWNFKIVPEFSVKTSRSMNS